MKRSSVLSLLLLLACSGSEVTPRSKHVLVIGIDGVRVDALRQASTPELDELIAGGTVTYEAFAGGVLGTPSEQGTWSGPGWASILTGVWIDKHGVRFNGFVDARFDEYPHFFARIREQKPDAYLSSFVTWGPIHDHILASAEADTAFWPEEANDSAEGDVTVTEAVVEHLAAEDPDVVFVQLDEVDHQGHVAGFSPTVSEYVGALEIVDGQIGRMIDAVRARSTVDDEDWLIVVTTDHGGLGVAHGEQSDEERTVFLIVSGGTTRRAHEISPGPGHTAIPPTAVKHLDLSIDPAWGWESEPFGL